LKPVLPPISSATGGLMPGINLDESSALQEGDEVDAARRLR